MSLKCGIVGLPNVGKSTLFNALTKAGIAAENYPFCTIAPNVGIVEVPHPGHPLGVRGVGETPICGPMAAVTTALNHAVNTRVRDLPLTRERVLAGLGVG